MVSHARAADKRAEEAIIASKIDVSMAKGSDFGVLASEEEARGYSSLDNAFLGLINPD